MLPRPCRGPLFDHLVGEREQRGRHLKTDHLRGFQVDDKVELGWLEDGQIGGLLALEPGSYQADEPPREGRHNDVANKYQRHQCHPPMVRDCAERACDSHFRCSLRTDIAPAIRRARLLVLLQRANLQADIP
jgi:hypothetical protein